MQSTRNNSFTKQILIEDISLGMKSPEKLTLQKNADIKKSPSGRPSRRKTI